MFNNFYKNLAILLDKLRIFPFYLLSWFFWVSSIFFFFSFFGFFFHSDYFFFFRNFIDELDILSFGNLHIDNFLSHFYIYKFNFYSNYYYAPGFTLSYFPLDNAALAVFKKVFIQEYLSIFCFPYFEDGILVPRDNSFLQTISEQSAFFHPSAPSLFSWISGYLDFWEKDKRPKFLDPLFANYFLINFYNFDYFDELKYPASEEIFFFWGLNFLHFYHFDYLYDSDLGLKFVYKSLADGSDLDITSFLQRGYDGNVFKELFIDLNDIRNSFFWECYYKLIFQIHLEHCWWYFFHFYFLTFFFKAVDSFFFWAFIPDTWFPFVWSEFFFYVFLVFFLLIFYVLLILFNFFRFFSAIFRIIFVFINYFFYVVYYLFFGYFRLEEYEEGESSFFVRPEPYNNSFNTEQRGFPVVHGELSYGDWEKIGKISMFSAGVDSIGGFYSLFNKPKSNYVSNNVNNEFYFFLLDYFFSCLFRFLYLFIYFCFFFFYRFFFILVIRTELFYYFFFFFVSFVFIIKYFHFKFFSYWLMTLYIELTSLAVWFRNFFFTFFDLTSWIPVDLLKSLFGLFLIKVELLLMRIFFV